MSHEGGIVHCDIVGPRVHIVSTYCVLGVPGNTVVMGLHCLLHLETNVTQSIGLRHSPLLASGPCRHPW